MDYAVVSYHFFALPFHRIRFSIQVSGLCYVSYLLVWQLFNQNLKSTAITCLYLYYSSRLYVYSYRYPLHTNKLKFGENAVSYTLKEKQHWLLMVINYYSITKA